MFSWNRLPRGVKALFFTQVINRAGDLVVPFLTLLLTQVLGLAPAAAGATVSLATLLGSLGGLLAGKLADRYGRRDVLVVFLATSALLIAGAGWAPRELASAAVLVVAGFFFGAMRPLVNALVGDLSTPSTRREAFSLSYFGINLGVALGPLLAGWLFHNALSWLFWLDALSTALALAVVLKYVPRNTHPVVPASRGQEESRPKNEVSSLAQFVRHPLLFPYALLLLSYSVVYSQMNFTLALQLVESFGAEQGPPVFGLVWGVNALGVVVLMPLVLRLTRRWRNLPSMALALFVAAAGLLIFLFHPNLTWVLISTVVWTAGEVLYSVHEGDFVTTQSPPELRARFQAYVGFASSLGYVVAPVVSGWVTQTVGLGGVWAGSVALLVVAGGGFALLKSANRDAETPTN